MMTDHAFKLDHTNLETARGIQKLMISSYAEEARLLGVTDFPPLKRSAAHIRGTHSDFYGYEHKGILAAVGELESDKNKSVNNIASLAVGPKFFRMGIGARLLQHLIALSRGRKVTVSTASSNLPAIALYRKHGFKLLRKSKVEGELVIVTLCRNKRGKAETNRRRKFSP